MAKPNRRPRPRVYGTDRDRVVIGCIHPGTVRAEFARSVLNTVVANREMVHAVMWRKSGPLIAAARNDLVTQYLADHADAAAWLLMVDTDMVFSPTALPRLLDAADPTDCPIVGGLCYAEHEEDGQRHTMLELLQNPDGSVAFGHYEVWPEDELFPVGGTGAAFLLVHRDAYRRIAAGWGDGCTDELFPWFRESTLAGRRRIGEDLTFCLRAQSAGIPVHVHTGVQVGHMKTTMLGKVT